MATHRARGAAAALLAALTCHAASVAIAAAPAPDRTDPVLIRTDKGTVRGRIVPGGRLFADIPFAAPPVGMLRWRVAQPASPWRGTRDATRFGAICPQPAGGTDEAGAPQSEDCLTLNVLVPDHAVDKPLPVLAYVHGGAFFVGSGRDPVARGVTALVRQGIIVVSMNYRLGRLGFFAHPALTAEAKARGEPVANFWLSDQVAALRWIRRNVARFGGDPAQVTIMGCSAGGSSIDALMTTPSARGLFARAAAHSGGGLFNATRPLALAERQGAGFGASVGAAGQGSAALGRMRALTPAQVLAADRGPPDFGAIVDGRLLPSDISTAFAQGRIAQVPFAVGSTDNEASIFGLMGFDRAVLKARFGIDMDAVRGAYEGAGRLDDAELLRQVQTDFIFTSGAVGLAALATRGRQPVYAYNFTYVPAARRGVDKGAPHCADMGYIFGPALGDDPGGAEVAGRLQRYWGNFIRTGDPNGAGLPEWPRFTAVDRAVLVMDEATAPVRDFRRAQLAPWFAMWTARTGDRVDR